jgi:hypothetical protein
VYGINGKLFSEMTFKWSSGLQVPVTYLWEFDGTRLHFTPFGLDLRDHRKYVYSKTLTYSSPLLELNTAVKENSFPIGRFVSQNGTRAFEFDEEGTWRFFDGDLENLALSGKYITTGDLYTEMTHNNPDESQIAATYYWAFDGENLTFDLWGEDFIEYREGIYNQQTYILDDE